MAKPLEVNIIEGALKIISDPKRWTKCADARDAKGRWCDFDDARAVRFCAQGAIKRAALDLGANANGAFAAVRIVEPSFANVNDGPDGRRKVIAIFNEAFKSFRL